MTPRTPHPSSRRVSLYAGIRKPDVEIVLRCSTTPHSGALVSTVITQRHRCRSSWWASRWALSWTLLKLFICVAASRRRRRVARHINGLWRRTAASGIAQSGYGSLSLAFLGVRRAVFRQWPSPNGARRYPSDVAAAKRTRADPSTGHWRPLRLRFLLTPGRRQGPIPASGIGTKQSSRQEQELSLRGTPAPVRTMRYSDGAARGNGAVGENVA